MKRLFHEILYLIKADIVAAIKYARELVEKQRNPRALKELRGFLPDSALDLYHSEKRKDLEQEESKAPLKKNKEK